MADGRTLAEILAEEEDQPQSFTLAEIVQHEAELDEMGGLGRARRAGMELNASVVQQVGDVLGGATRPGRALWGALGVPEGAMRFVHPAAEVADMTQRAAQAIRPEPSPAFESGYAGTFAEQEGARAVGSGIGFLALGGAVGALTGLGAGATAALIGGLGQAEAQYQEAVQAGKDENSPEAWAAYAAGMGIGQTERFGIGRILGRLNKATGGTVRRLLGEMAREGAEETAQEALQTTLGNVVARNLYDEEREYLEGVVEAGKAGGFAGVVLSALGTGLSRSLRQGGSEPTGTQAEGPAPTTQEGAGAPPQAEQPATAAESAQERPAEPEARPVALIPERAIPAFLRFRDAQPAEARPRLRPVAPQTKAEQWAAEFARARGAEAVVVDAGAPLPLPAMYAEGTVFLDARADERAQLAQVAYHEMTHHLAAVQPGGFEEIVRAIGSVDPDGLAAAEADYRAEFAQRTGRALPADIAAEEGVARYVETVAKYVEGAFADPQRMVRLATEQPSLVRRLLDWLVEQARRLGVTGLSTSLEKVQAEFGAAPGALTEQQAAAIALKIREGFNGLLGRAVPEGRQVEAPTVRAPAAEKPAAPRRKPAAPKKAKPKPPAKPDLPPVPDADLAGLTPRQRRAEKKRRRRAQVKAATEQRALEQARRAGLETGRRAGVRKGARQRGEAAREARLEEAREAVREAGAEPLFALADRFAVAEPSDEQTRRVLRQTEKALTVSGETAVGSSPTIIAERAEDRGVRALQRGAREVRALEMGGMDVQHIADVEQRAQVALDDHGREEWKRRLLEKIGRGDALNEVETVIADAIKTDAALAALAGNDLAGFTEAAKLSWAYQEARRTTARTLGLIRDAVKPARVQMAELLATPGRERRKRLDRLRQRQEKSQTREKREEMQRRIDRELEKDAEETLAARKALTDAGFHPDLVTSDYFDDPVTRGRIVRIVHEEKSGTWDWLIEWRLAAMLSGPLTHVANITGNTYQFAKEVVAKRAAEAMVNAVVKDPDSAQAGELRAVFQAIVPGLRSAGHYFLESYRTQMPAFEADLRGMDEEVRSKIDSLYGPAIPGRLGRAMRAPSLTTLLAFDEAFKAMAAVMEGHALAYRQAKKEGLSGEAVGRRMTELLAEPTADMQERMMLQAEVVTFQDTQDNAFLRWVRTGRDMLRIPMPWGLDPFPLGRLLIPFTNTPVRIFQTGLGDVFSPLTLLGKAIAGGYRGDRRALTRDMAHAALSASVAIALLYLLDRDEDELPRITGTRDWDDPIPAQSIRVGGTWYTYARLDPLAVQTATIIDLAEARDFTKLSQSLFRQMADKTFLRTIGDVYDATVEAERHEGMTARMVRDQFFTAFVPNLIRQPARQMDEAMRAQTVRKHEDSGVWEASARSLPYAALPAAGQYAPPIRYDMLGRPVRRRGTRIPALLRLVTPMQDTLSVAELTDVDLAIIRYNERVHDGDLPDARPIFPRPPATYVRVDGENRYLSDEQYAAYTKRAGELTFEALRGRELPTDERLYDIVRDAASDAREKAKRELRIRESFQP